MNELNLDISDIEKRMSGAIISLKNDFLSLRTGRASSSMLDPVVVEVYGSKVPLNQCATITVPESRVLSVNVWDLNNVNMVEKALINSGLGLTPQTEGNFIRLIIPELNEERRTELKKLIKSMGEKCKISIRNIRRDANEELKKLLKSKEIGEDEEKTFEKNVQNITDKHIEIVDEKVSSKEKEIMTI